MSSNANTRHLGFALLSWILAAPLTAVVGIAFVLPALWITGAVFFGSYAASKGRRGDLYGICAVIVGPVSLLIYLAISDPST
jgi:thiamine transporter ThiT